MSSKLLGYMLLLVDVVGYNQEEMYIIYIYIYIYVCASRVVSMLLHLSYVDNGFSHVEGP